MGKAAISTFDDSVQNILESTQMGLWNIIIGDGEPRFIMNKTTADLVGVDESTSPEGAYQFWISHVPDFYLPDVNNCVAEILKGAKAEVTYTYNHPTRGNIWIRCGGMLDPTYKGKGQCLRGCHQDVTTYMKMVNEKQNILTTIGKTYYCIYTINFETGTMTEVAAPESMNQVIGSNGNATDLLKRMHDTYVTEDTKELTSDFINWNTIQNRLQDQDTTSVTYRSSKLGWCNSSFIVSERKADGFVSKFLFTTKIVDNEFSKKLEQQHIINSLSKEYTNIFIINKKRRTIRSYIIRSEGMKHIKYKEHEEYDHDTFIQSYANIRVHPDDAQSFTENLSYNNFINVIEKNKSLDHHFRIIERNGETHSFLCHMTTIDHSDEVLACLRNVDAILKKEAETRACVEDALQIAKQANKAKSIFLNNMSHDIRTPMNAIVGYTSLALTHIDEKQRITDYLKKIEKASDHLLELINNILDMSRIEAGKIILDEKPDSLLDITDQVISIIKSNASIKNQTINVTTENVTTPNVYVDSLRLKQVLINTISNAIKYTPNNGTIDVKLQQEQNATEQYDTFIFTITDNGIGMTPEFLAHIFEPFSRENKNSTQTIEGTGLGMSITKNITELMRGSIDVKSKQDEGTTVTLTYHFRSVQ